MDREGKFPFPFRPVPGFKKERRYYADDVLPRIKDWKEDKARRAKQARRAAQRRFQRPISRQRLRRLERIKRLVTILRKKTPVSARDRELAIQYSDCLYELWQRREERKRERRWSQLSLRERRRLCERARELGIDLNAPSPLPDIPLLEGIHALYEEGYLKDQWGCPLEEEPKCVIQRLPVRSEAKPPQKKQSSLNASAQ